MSVESPTGTVARQVGRSMQRLDGREKLRGEAEFVGDMSVPGMLFGKVLRSPVPHARIVSIDASRAEAIPGVACVLTGRDLGDIDPYWGHAIKDRPIVAIDCVRFHGEPVAAVAADDEATAARAVLAIEVEYEQLPVAATVAEAIAPGAPLVNDGPLRPGLFHGLGVLPEREGNVCYRYRIERGEVEAALAHADIVVEGSYDFPAVYQYAMETHTVIAQVERGEITLWATCQHPFLGAGDRPVSRRRLRLEVVHEDGADRGRTRPQGPSPGADPERGRRVDGHLAAPRHEGARADRRDERRSPARARRRVLVRHGRLRRQRAAGHRDGR
jgi:CO/xanthine dehydrogenase Mo-binding subunit